MTGWAFPLEDASPVPIRVYPARQRPNQCVDIVPWSGFAEIAYHTGRREVKQWAGVIVISEVDAARGAALVEAKYLNALQSIRAYVDRSTRGLVWPRPSKRGGFRSCAEVRWISSAEAATLARMAGAAQ